MRLLFAAAALFVMLAGLAWLTYTALETELSQQVTLGVFAAFFMVGLVFFAASAFINTETVKIFLDAIRPLGGASRD